MNIWFIYIVLTVLLWAMTGLIYEVGIHDILYAEALLVLEQQCEFIHKDGLSAVEAGAYIVEVIEKILAAKASGVDLVK